MRLHHLAFRTDDLDRLVAFYRTWLGLEVVREAPPRSVWLGIGDALLMIERRDAGEVGLPSGSLELAAFAVSDDERLALRGRLVAAGRLEAETRYTLYFRDPDGRRIGVSAFPIGTDPA